MIYAGAGQSSHGGTQKAVEEPPGAAMAQAGVAKADAAVVFFTVEHAANAGPLLEGLRRGTGTDRIVGSSGAGMLTQQGEIEGSQGLAVLVFSSDQIVSDPFLYKPLRERDQEIGGEIGGGRGGGGGCVFFFF